MARVDAIEAMRNNPEHRDPEQHTEAPAGGDNRNTDKSLKRLQKRTADLEATVQKMNEAGNALSKDSRTTVNSRI